MVKLSVNVNKLATLRNARGGNMPNVLQVSQDILDFGAQGITIHPRPDQRHIRSKDVEILHDLVTRRRKAGSSVELNIEGYPDERFLDLLQRYPPQQATFVPDAPDTLTSNTGWNIPSNEPILRKSINFLHEKGIRSSLFVNADPSAIEAAKQVGAKCVELYTGPYALAVEEGEKRGAKALRPYLSCAERAERLDLRVHAGHDLSLSNLALFVKEMPFLDEISVGHALICEALYYGLQNVVGMYLELIKRNAHES